jgi:NDP-sugar pyrophosphorylase family protein
MNLVICIAGLNTRFHNAGFDIPKYLLPFGESTIISCILSEIIKHNPVNEIVLVANIRDKFFEQQLRDATDAFDPIIIWTHDTPGQATTALIGVEKLIEVGLGDEPVIIHNGDTVVSISEVDPKMSDLISAHDVCVNTFPGNSPAWSYVTCEPNSDILVSMNEKEIVTGHASSGFYGFRSSQFYKESYFDTIFTSNEFYISNVISSILNKKGLGIKFEIRLYKPIILGTPAEYFDALELAGWNTFEELDKIIDNKSI